MPFFCNYKSMHMFDFDSPINRLGTNSFKYEFREKYFKNPDVIPLWVADMDFASPPAITKAIKERIEHPVYGYTVRNSSFNTSIKNWLHTRHNWDIETSWIEFSPGVVSGLSLSVLAYTKPGDGIIIQPPVYPPFFSVVKDNDRKLAYNPLLLDDGKYNINFKELEQLASKPENKMLILCSPHNPVGRLWNKDELSRLGEICIKNDVLVISDEIHSDLALFGNRHIPFASINESFANNSVTFMAPSKTFNIAGFSTSYIVCENRELRKKYQKVLHSLHLYTGHLLGGVVLESAYNHGAEWLDELTSYLEGNITFVEEFITTRLPWITFTKPEATYLLWLDFRKTGWKQDKITSFLYKHANVGMNDGTLFGEEGRGFMRMNIGSPRSVLNTALINIEKAFNESDLIK